MYDNKVEFSEKNTNSTGKWIFGAEIANRFTDEAEKNIPDYWKVINITINILKENIPEDGFIVDVGCASGNTLSALYKHGFKNLFGIDASKDMLEIACKKLVEIDRDFPNRLFHSKTQNIRST